MKLNIENLRAAEAGWLLISLCEQGVQVLKLGWCVGELRPGDIEMRCGAVQRVARRRMIDALRHRLAAQRHRKAGHDRGCVTLGVPIGTLHSFATAWAGEDAGELLSDALEEAIEQIHAGEWPAVDASVAVKHVIGRRITLCVPTDHERSFEAGLVQMPRFASNRPSSSRAFIWFKKRAASAPSIIR